MSNKGIYVIRHIHLYRLSDSRLAIVPPFIHPFYVAKNLNTGHRTQTFKSNLFIPVMFIGTIDFYHFISVTLTLAGSNKPAQTKQVAHFSAKWDETKCNNKATQAKH